LGILAIFLVSAQCVVATRYHFLKRYSFFSRHSNLDDPTDDNDSKRLGTSMAQQQNED